MRATRDFVTQALAREELLPNKNLGQNFCVDEGVLKRLAAALPLDGRTVLEIGPGLGALTEQLLAAGARVYAVEKDGRLYDFLRRDLVNDRLTLVHEDCLKTDYGFLPPDFVAAGNLPYCITADIVTMLLSLRPAGMLLMVQKEAADRFFAKPSQKNYGPVAMVSQLYYTPTLLAEVPPEGYLPPPTVTSALVKLEARPDAPQESTESLLKFAAACLRMRRKTLYNNLTGMPDLKGVLLDMGLAETIRGEALTPEQLLMLYRRLNAK
jgi:16S rRNA (adenine1518-N6/adenine1519-N6)-dimethyltransferase